MSRSASAELQHGAPVVRARTRCWRALPRRPWDRWRCLDRLNDASIVRNLTVSAIMAVSDSGTLAYASNTASEGELVSVSRKGESAACFALAYGVPANVVVKLAAGCGWGPRPPRRGRERLPAELSGVSPEWHVSAAARMARARHFGRSGFPRVSSRWRDCLPKPGHFVGTASSAGGGRAHSCPPVAHEGGAALAN